MRTLLAILLTTAAIIAPAIADPKVHTKLRLYECTDFSPHVDFYVAFDFERDLAYFWVMNSEYLYDRSLASLMEAYKGHPCAVFSRGEDDTLKFESEKMKVGRRPLRGEFLQDGRLKVTFYDTSMEREFRLIYEPHADMKPKPRDQ